MGQKLGYTDLKAVMSTCVSCYLGQLWRHVEANELSDHVLTE